MNSQQQRCAGLRRCPILLRPLFSIDVDSQIQGFEDGKIAYLEAVRLPYLIIPQFFLHIPRLQIRHYGQ